MAVFMNAKGTQSSVFQVGKRGSKIFGSTTTPTASDVTTGDLWFDISNNETKIASKPGDTVTWNKIITENFGDVTISGNLTVSGTTTTVNSTTVEVQNAMVFEGATSDAYETTLTTVDPTADRTVRLPNASGTLVLSGAVGVSDLAADQYVATGETWNDNDSELATTGRISDFIGTEIANSSVIMHTTGNESFAGNKTFTGTTRINTLGVNGEYTFPTSDGSADQVLKTDGSGALSFGAVSVTNVAKVTSLSFGSITDYDVITTSATVTGDFGAISTANNGTLNDHGFIFTDTGLPQLPSYTVATLPNTVAGDLALCTDETGGTTVVFFDGTNWRRMADRAVAS